MGRPIVIKFDELTYKEYKQLKNSVLEGKKAKNKPSYKQLLISINNSLNNIKEDYNQGNLIPRKYISKNVLRRYGTDKIFRIELVGYWRLLYTIIGDETKIIVLVLEYMDHKKYNQIFGYRKR